MTLKEKTYHLVEVLPEERLPEAERLLKGLLADPLLALLANAPEDHAPYTEEQQRADEAARECSRRGEGVPHEEVGRLASARG